MDPLLDRCPQRDLVDEVTRRLTPCAGDCNSHVDAECWPAQATERVRKAHVTVVDVAVPGAVPPPGRRCVVDDMRGWVADVDDEEALRRIGLLPSGNESVAVFTPGLHFLVSRLGGVPSSEGTNGGWRFESDPALARPALWTAPPGYGPASRILARESRSLVEERARRWNADVGAAPLWGEDLEDLTCLLRGVAKSPTHPTVLVPSLGGMTARSPLLLGLRLAAAASHASERVVCLSPVLAEVLGVGGGLVCGVDEGTVPRALDPGAILLGGRRGRAQATWTSPLTRPRLELVGATRSREVAAALHRWTAGRGRVLAGIPEADRHALVELIAQLQDEALDGGPLGVRAVVLVTGALAGTDVAQSPELRLRALERGRRLVTAITIGDLHTDAVHDWARRNQSVAWIFPNSECILESQDRESIHRFFGALRRSQARVLLFADHVPDARRIRDLVNPHYATDPVSVIEEYVDGLDPAGWTMRNLGGLTTQCPDCSRQIVYRVAFELCPECGVPVDAVASVRRSLRIAFESRVVDALRQLGPQAHWTVIVFDPARKSRLMQRLGLGEDFAEDAPLLSSVATNDAAAVLVPDDLWRSEAPPEPVIVVGLPADLAQWSRVAGRLRAMGIEGGQWWLGPAGLDETVALPGAGLVLQGRRELLAESMGSAKGVEASSTLRRLEAAGGSWSGPSHLRVHELVRSPQADDAPLVALTNAARSGVIPQTSVTSLPSPPPAELERAVRSGARLRAMPISREEKLSPPGAVVGIAGYGKTARLLECAASAASNGESVLVIVPQPGGRLEWAERMADPGVACLDFDEFLLCLAGDREGLQLRTLPPADLRSGEEVRLSLVHRASELYAEEKGELPAVDSRSIVRAIEGERLASGPTSARTSVDYAALERCIARAKAESGWTGSRELLALARSRRAGGAMRAYGTVLVDDAQDLPEGGLQFLQECFGERLAGWAIDPVTGLVPESRVGNRAMESRRFGPAIADAIERIWRATTPLPAPVRGLAPGRSVADSERILALTTATERIAEELSTDDMRDSIAIVAASERDRRMMAQQLSVRSIEVDGPDRDRTDLVAGPREVLAALAWIAGAGPASTELLEVVLQAGPEPTQSAQAAHYEGRLLRRIAGEEVEVLDRVEAFLLPLVLIRGALGPSTRVESAVDVLLGCGLLQRLTDQPGMARRIGNFVRQYRGLTVGEVLDTVGIDRILRPATGGSAVKILSPDQLGGRVFDRVYYICTGFEPPERHYRVISTARSAVKIACSEVDPLQG